MMSKLFKTVSIVLITHVDPILLHLEDLCHFFWKMWWEKKYFQKIGQIFQDHDESEFGIFGDEYIPYGLLIPRISSIAQLLLPY